MAIDYLNENTRTKVVVSGGQGKGEDINRGKSHVRLSYKNGIKVIE